MVIEYFIFYNTFVNYFNPPPLLPSRAKSLPAGNPVGTCILYVLLIPLLRYGCSMERLGEVYQWIPCQCMQVVWTVDAPAMEVKNIYV